MMDWNDLRYLLEVARGGSTAAAARALGVNQSTVVRRVSVLEEELGFRLFDKRRNGYRLTPEGAALVEQAGAVEASVISFTRCAASLDQTLSGSLRVTAPEGISLHDFMSPLVDGFQRRYPAIRVGMVIDNRFLDLGSGQADVAIRAGDPKDDSLVGRKLMDCSWAIYGSSSHLACYGRPGTANDLNGRRVIGFDGDLEAIRVARRLQETAPQAEITIRCATFYALLSAARAGLGLALLPCHIGDPEAGLLRVIGPLPELTGALWILTRPDLHKTPRVRAFIDFMVAEVEPYKALMLGQVVKPCCADGAATAERTALMLREGGEAIAAGSDPIE